MSYCVHCGVKLGEAEKKCPLCQTEVIDPSTPHDERAPRKPYPVRSFEQTLLINRRYSVSLVSLLLLVPAGICMLLDLLDGELTWGIYPAGVLVLIWIASTVLLLMHKHRIYGTVLITGGTLAAYLYMVELLSNTEGWFLPIVLPVLLLTLAFLCLMIWMIRSGKLRILHLISAGLIEIGILCFVVELLCVLSVPGKTSFTWSLFVIMPCFFLALLLYVISRNGPLSTELKRRFHF